MAGDRGRELEGTHARGDFWSIPMEWEKDLFHAKRTHCMTSRNKAAMIVVDTLVNGWGRLTSWRLRCTASEPWHFTRPPRRLRRDRRDRAVDQDEVGFPVAADGRPEQYRRSDTRQ